MTSKTQIADRTEYLDRLRATLQPGDVVHTVLRHVSASGMSRIIDAYKFYVREDGEIDRHWLSYWISHAGIGSWDDRREAIRVGGTGMDMGFHVVYSLSRALFPDGFDCIGERCPSNDHINGDREYSPHHHADGGYALRQRWL